MHSQQNLPTPYAPHALAPPQPGTVYRGPSAERPRPPARSTPARPAELAALALLVLAADVLFYSYEGGVARAMLFPAVAALLLAFARRRRLTARLAGVLCLLGVVSAGLAFRATASGVLLGAALVGGTAVAMRVRRTYFADLSVSVLLTMVAAPLRLRGVARGVRNLAGRGRKSSFELRTILVPAGLAAVFTGIFALANPVLEAWIARVLSLSSVPRIGRPLFWLGAATIGAALLRPAFRRAVAWAEGHRADPSAVGECTDAGVSTARNALVALNLVFLVANGLDAVSLWAGRPPAGVGYTAYAHSGAFWLTVALLLSTVVLGAIFRGPYHFDPRARTLRLLAYAWLVQDGALALGTLRRIQIYVELTGLTSLRIFGVLGALLVVVGLALISRMIHGRLTTTWLIHRQLDACALFVALFVAAPTQLLSTELNVARVSAGQYAPVLHILEKTDEPENVAPMIRLLDHPDPVVRRGVASLLLGRQSEILTPAARPLLDTDISTRAAARALARADDRIVALAREGGQSAVDDLRRLAVLANADEARFDYRGRGGVRDLSQ